MTIKNFSCGLTSSLLLGVLASPLAVYAQFAPIQNAEQSVTIRGNNNTVNQSITQTVIYQRPTFGSKDKKKKYKKYSKYGPYGKKYWKKNKDKYKSKGWKKGWEYDDDGWERDDDD